MSARPNLYHSENEYWTKNPGYNPFRRNPEAECRFLYVCGQESKGPDKARNRIWQIRGWDFDIHSYHPMGKA